jgi:23S rRNA G2445 N2-methylase RlmL
VLQRPLSELEPPGAGPGGGRLIANPPYGVRVQRGGDLRDLYATLGRLARERLPGWSVGLLVADPALAAATGLRLSTRFRTSNGGIAVRFMTTSE